VAQPAGEGVVRLGLPEDFAAYRLADMLSDFARSRPGLRLDVRCGLSVRLAHDLERGELDLALYKRSTGDGSANAAAKAIAIWPERLHWIASARNAVDTGGSVPLAAYEQGCLYRNRAIHALEAAGRAWHIAYTSPNLAGIQAAVSAGLGVSILPDVAHLPDHRVLGRADGFPPIPDTELALLVAPEATPAARRLAARLADFCHAVQAAEAVRISRRDSARPQKRKAAARR
jgi:DNA-binding transcriptional LysR family regulator